MAIEYVSQRVSSASMEYRQLVLLLNALIDAIRVVTVKLDADGTVTDTNYTAVFDAVVKK